MLARLIVLVVLIVGIAWLIVRVVSVQNTPDKVQITIDKQPLREAGQKAEQGAKHAVDSTGKVLRQAGEKIEGWRHQEESRAASSPEPPPNQPSGQEPARQP
jgi:hypothetical protein